MNPIWNEVCVDTLFAMWNFSLPKQKLNCMLGSTASPLSPTPLDMIAFILIHFCMSRPCLQNEKIVAPFFVLPWVQSACVYIRLSRCPSFLLFLLLILDNLSYFWLFDALSYFLPLIRTISLLFITFSAKVITAVKVISIHFNKIHCSWNLKMDCSCFPVLLNPGG